MSGYLLDTNVLSELRKEHRCDTNVRQWFDAIPEEDVHVSVLTLGEIRNGIERLRLRDPKSAESLDVWLAGLRNDFASRILLVDGVVADRWGRLNPVRPRPIVDGLLAATALEHKLVLTTRNQGDVAETGVTWFNPFTGAKSS